jgi:hypothetical protein
MRAQENTRSIRRSCAENAYSERPKDRGLSGRGGGYGLSRAGALDLPKTDKIVFTTKSLTFVLSSWLGRSSCFPAKGQD